MPVWTECDELRGNVYMCFVWAPFGIRSTVLLLLFCRAYGTFNPWRETPGCTNTGLQKTYVDWFQVCRAESVAFTFLPQTIKLGITKMPRTRVIMENRHTTMLKFFNSWECNNWKNACFIRWLPSLLPASKSEKTSRESSEGTVPVGVVGGF